jgi:hypothetical protein
LRLGSRECLDKHVFSANSAAFLSVLCVQKLLSQRPPRTAAEYAEKSGSLL